MYCPWIRHSCKYKILFIYLFKSTPNQIDGCFKVDLKLGKVSCIRDKQTNFYYIFINKVFHNLQIISKKTKDFSKQRFS